MNTFNNEKNILKFFRRCETEEILLSTQDKSIKNMLHTILDDTEWKKWVDSSGKNELPPDYYCPENKIMMEIMRIDDHAYKNEQGKVINPTTSRESKIAKEIKKAIGGINDDTMILSNVDTGLAANEDHNYSYYKSNFIRVIEKHKAKINQYRNNHHDYKLIFLVFDESSGSYAQTRIKNSDIDMEAIKSIEGKPHIYCYDKAFLEVFKDTDIDYFIWYAPYKNFQTDAEMVFLPKASIYDVKNMNFQMIEYDEDYMISLEK